MAELMGEFSGDEERLQVDYYYTKVNGDDVSFRRNAPARPSTTTRTPIRAYPTDPPPSDDRV